MKKSSILAIAAIVLICCLSSCAETHHVEKCLPNDPSGFWSGLWHGMIAPFAFIGHLFDSSIAVYDVNNNGGWYDFGFLLGIGAFTWSSTEAAS